MIWYWGIKRLFLLKSIYISFRLLSRFCKSFFCHIFTTFKKIHSLHLQIISILIDTYRVLLNSKILIVPPASIVLWILILIQNRAWTFTLIHYKLKRYFLLNQIFVEWALFCDVLRLEWAYSTIWHCKFFNLLVFWLNHFLRHEYYFLISLNYRFLVIILWRYFIWDVKIVVLKGIIFYLIVFCDLILDAIISLI